MYTFTVFCSLLCICIVSADTNVDKKLIALHSVFGDGMVLQRETVYGQHSNVYGTVDLVAAKEYANNIYGEENVKDIFVHALISNQIKYYDEHGNTDEFEVNAVVNTTEIENGLSKWYAKFDRMASGGAWDIFVYITFEVVRPEGSSYETKTDRLDPILSSAAYNIKVGDVWLCAGDEDLQLSVADSYEKEKMTEWILQEIDAGRDRIRYMDIQNYEWRNLSTLLTENPETGALFLDEISATCFGFASKLRDYPMIPALGVIQASKKETSIKSWIPKLTDDERSYNECSSLVPIDGGDTYNEILQQFEQFTIYGIIWDQGLTDLMDESMPLDKTGYPCLLSLFINGVRDRFSAIELSTDKHVQFIQPQILPNTALNHQNSWRLTAFRMAQQKVESRLKNVYVAQTYDIGDPWPFPEKCKENNCCNSKADFVPDSQCTSSVVDNTENIVETFPVQSNWNAIPFPRNRQRLSERLARLAASSLFAGSSTENGIQESPKISGCENDNGILSIYFEASTMERGKLNYGSGSFDGTLGLIEGCVGVHDECLCYYWKEDGDNWVCQIAHETYNKTVPIQTNEHPNNVWKPLHFTEMLGINALRFELPAEDIKAIRYGWNVDESDSTCCTNADIASGTMQCKPGSCPITTLETKLPIVPFQLLVDNAQCECLKPNGCVVPSVSFETSIPTASPSITPHSASTLAPKISEESLLHSPLVIFWILIAGILAVACALREQIARFIWGGYIYTELDKDMDGPIYVPSNQLEEA